MLRQALAVDPKLAKTHFFLGTVLKNLGRYDEALSALREAAAQYPRDRVVLNQLGRVLFLQREFGPAVDTFKQVLAIDPEDLQAHYNLMLCYQGLGDAAGVERERVLYTRFKADEAVAGDHRDHTDSCTRTTTTSGSRSTSIAGHERRVPRSQPRRLGSAALGLCLVAAILCAVVLCRCPGSTASRPRRP